MKNKRLRFAACCAALLGVLLQSGIASAFTSITIQNGGFDQTPIQSPPKSWSYGSNETGGSVTQTSDAADFYRSGWIYQGTGVSLLANQTYVFSVNIWCSGVSPCSSNSEYPGDVALELWAGSTWASAKLVTGTTVSSQNIGNGTSPIGFSLVFSTPSNSPLIGQQIWVRIIQIQESPARVESVYLDNVNLAYYSSGTGSPKLVQGTVTDMPLWSTLCADAPTCTGLLGLQYTSPYDGLDINSDAGLNALCDPTQSTCACRYPSSGNNHCDTVANGVALLSSQLEAVKLTWESNNTMTPANWGRFTENYVNMQVTSLLNWYEDASWTEILNKIGIVAELAEAGTQGIFFDPEGTGTLHGAAFTYSSYSQLLPGVSYADMANKVYARGVQVGERIVDGNGAEDGNLPGMTHKHFMVTKWTSLLPPTIGGTNFWLQGNTYDLLTPFMLGILSELDLGSGNTIIDGSENDYNAKSTGQYQLSQQAIYTTAISDGVIPTADQGSYNQNMFYSSAIEGDASYVGSPYMSNLSGTAQSAYYNASPLFYSQGPSNLSWFFYNGNGSGVPPLGANEALQQAKAFWLSAHE